MIPRDKTLLEVKKYVYRLQQSMHPTGTSRSITTLTMIKRSILIGFRLSGFLCGRELRDSFEINSVVALVSLLFSWSSSIAVATVLG